MRASEGDTAAIRERADEANRTKDPIGNLAVGRLLLDLYWAIDEVEGLRTVLGNFVDDEPCRLDHHGGCQAHGFTELDGFECPMSAARRALGGPS